MIFWNKPSNITLDAFTFSETIGLNFPIAPASKFYPKEWRDYPKDIVVKSNDRPESNLTENLPTIKYCNGITDLFAAGFILPSWATVSIECLGERNFNFSTQNMFSCDSHGRNQFGDMYNGYANIKFMSPWLLHEKTGVKFVWSQPSYHRYDIRDNFAVPNAVVDYKYQFATNINCFQKYNSIINIVAGDPLVHMIPMTDKRVKLKVHILSKNEYDKKNNALIAHAAYHGHRNLKYPQVLKTSKCPFGFK